MHSQPCLLAKTCAAMETAPWSYVLLQLLLEGFYCSYKLGHFLGCLVIQCIALDAGDQATPATNMSMHVSLSAV